MTAVCYKLTCINPNIFFGARMYHFFKSEKIAGKKLKNFNGKSEKQELTNDCVDWLDNMFANDKDDDFSLIVPDGKEITAEKRLLEALESL